MGTPLERLENELAPLVRLVSKENLGLSRISVRADDLKLALDILNRVGGLFFNSADIQAHRDEDLYALVKKMEEKEV